MPWHHYMVPGISENNLVKFVTIIFFLKIFHQTLFLKVYSRLLAPIINHPLASINTDVHSIDTDGKSLKLQI